MVDDIAMSGALTIESDYDGPPYVGPQPFKEGQERIFCGRDREKNDLCSLIIANSEVLLHAQSGAGKSSLLNAGVIPKLRRKGFTVRPVTRVRTEKVDLYSRGKITNVFMFNALCAWVDAEREFDRIASLQLADFLDLEKPGAKKAESLTIPKTLDESPVIGRQLPELLIFDQLEEIFELWPEKWREREDFFSQIADALERGKHLRVLFAIREDYLARLFPCLELLPRRMKVRFQLEPLNKGSAVHAVEDPLSRIVTPKRTFAAGVAKKLVENLSRVKARGTDGKINEVSGEYVEPMQLALVCADLWRRLPADVQEINEDQVKDYGNVDGALSAYYETCLVEAAKTGISEGKLRGFFGQALITAEGTRGIVYRGRDNTGGIPNTAVDVLKDMHLIRQEDRAGGGWYELSHDRFIGPIQQSNEEWLTGQGPSAEMKNRLTHRLAAWVAAGRTNKKLLSEADLEEAKNWVQSAGPTGFGYPPELRDLIAKSDLEHAIAAAAAGRKLLFFMTIAIVSLLAAVVIGFISGWTARKQSKSEELGLRSRLSSLTPKRKLLLALQSVGYYPSVSSLEALDSALQSARTTQRLQIDAIASVSFDDHRGRFATTGIDGKVRIWQATTSYVYQTLAGVSAGINKQPPPASESGSGYDDAKNGQQLTSPSQANTNTQYNKDIISNSNIEIDIASACSDKLDPDDRGQLPLSNGSVIRLMLTLKPDLASSELRSVSLTPDGQFAITTEDSGSMRLWNLNKRCQISSWPQSDGMGSLAKLSPDGQMLATAGNNGYARLWSFAGESLHPVLTLNCSGSDGTCGKACDTTGTQALSWSGKMLAAATSAGVTLWDVQKRTCVRSIVPSKPEDWKDDAISVVALRADGRRVAFGSKRGIVEIWNFDRDNKPRVSSDDMERRITALAFSDPGNLLAVSSLGGGTKIWRTDKEAPSNVLATEQRIVGMSFDPGENYLSAVDDEGGVVEHSVNVDTAKRLAALSAVGDPTADKEFPISRNKCEHLVRQQVTKNVASLPIGQRPTQKQIEDLLKSAGKDCAVLEAESTGR